MPGILIMNHSGSDSARDGDSKKRSFDGKLLNGDRNGDHKGDRNDMAVGPPADAAALKMAPTPDNYAELPPEIAHIPPEAYHPLSKLLLRISQECYSGLDETLQAMAQMPAAQHPNGIVTNGIGDNPEVNRRKKLLLMKFAQESRAKFIKLLVLTEWGKKSAFDVSKVIDLYDWSKNQAAHMDYVDEQVNQIKMLSAHARENNPDIRTALEILSTGKASWMPTLDYIPPEPISSDKALKLLRSMNTSLSIRLNVHESLPRHLRNWQIQSGRATFVIDDEMEFDVVSFVEDDSDQWWFIDIRLLFAQAPPITVGSRFFVHLKQQADFVLKEKGLSGLFDFLHNFILTHKITILRSQAAALARSDWAGSLKVEPVHRELVVQYWMDRPGKKNWIEIGTSSNKPRKGKTSWRGAPISSLTARWFRQGKEVVDVDLGFDWTDLSMERILKRVLALHTGHILRSTRDSFNSKLAVHAGLSETEPTDCTLQATLGTKANSLTLSLEPVTGSYILQPATALSARAEYAMNQGREPTQIANIITQLLAQALRDLVQRHAQQLGWQPVARQSLHLEIVKAAVKLDVLQYALYWPRGWTPKWALAVVIDTTGESWWILEIDSSGSTIEYAEQIKMERPDSNALVINRSTLASLERVAVQLLSFRITSRQLEKEAKTYSLRHEISQSSSIDAPRIVQGWVLYLQTSDLLVTKSGAEPWLESSIAIACEGIKADGRNVWHIASGRMGQAAAADMQKLMAASPQSNFSFTEDGCFRVLLSTPFGTDILGELKARLRDVDRLRSFATTLQKRQMRLGSSSLQKVQFQYGPAPHVAAVNFSAEKEIAIELSPNNPHHRIHKLLTEIANERNPSLPDMYQNDANGLDRFCTTLLLTRSLLTVLHELETTHALRNPSVHTHSVFKYRLTYTNPLCTFDIRLQPKHDKVFWLIEDNIKRAPDLRPSPERHPTHRRIDELQAKLKELFTSKGQRWFGTRNGIVAELDAAPEALRKLHATVISCEMPGGYKAPPPLEIPAQGQNQPQAQGQPQTQPQGRPQPQKAQPQGPGQPQGRPQQISPTMPRRQPPPTGLNMVRGAAPRMLQMPPQGLSQAQMAQQMQQQQRGGHGGHGGQGHGGQGGGQQRVKPQVIEID